LVFPGGGTPREFLENNAVLAGKYQRLWHGLQQATALYEQVVYSPHQPSPDEYRLLQSLLQGGRWDWLRLLLSYRWKALRKSLRERFKAQVR
jgi:hypothetical protein